MNVPNTVPRERLNQLDFTGVTEQTDSSDSMTQSVGFHRGNGTN